MQRRCVLIVLQLIMAIGTCRLCANEPKKDPPIKFTFFVPGDKNVVVVLGPISSRRFHETISSGVADFDLKFLQKSEPMGEFVLGKSIYESHVGIVVLTVNKKSKVWSSKFTKELTESILEDDGSYKLFLLK